MEDKNITTDQLAGMVQRGFESTSKEMKDGFDEVGKRLDRIEKLILKEHKRRIEALEAEMKEIRGLLAMK